MRVQVVKISDKKNHEEVFEKVSVEMRLKANTFFNRARHMQIDAVSSHNKGSNYIIPIVQKQTSNNLVPVEYNLIRDVAIKGDGACLYRALAVIFFGNDDHFNEVKFLCISYVYFHIEEFRESILLNRALTEGFTAEDYFNEAFKPESWGGEPELVAFTRIFGYQIPIIRDVTSRNVQRIGEDLPEPTCFMYYRQGAHYDVAVVVKRLTMYYASSGISKNNLRDYRVIQCISSDAAMGKGFAKEWVDKILCEDVRYRLRGKQVGSCTIFKKHVYLTTKRLARDKPTIATFSNSVIDMVDKLTNIELVNYNKEYFLAPLLGSGLDRLTWDSVVKSLVENLPEVFSLTISVESHDKLLAVLTPHTSKPFGHTIRSKVKYNKNFESEEFQTFSVDYIGEKKAQEKEDLDWNAIVEKDLYNQYIAAQETADVKEREKLIMTDEVKKQIIELAGHRSKGRATNCLSEIFRLGSVIEGIISIDGSMKSESSQVGQLVNSLMHERHNLFAMIASQLYNIDFTDDISVMSEVSFALNSMGYDKCRNDVIKKFRELDRQSKSQIERKTPDCVGFFRNSSGGFRKYDPLDINEADFIELCRRREVVLLVIDYTVTTDITTARSSKSEKYSIYHQLLPDYMSFEVITVAYNVNKDEIEAFPQGILPHIDPPELVIRCIKDITDVMNMATNVYGSNDTYRQTLIKDVTEDVDSWNQDLTSWVDESDFKNLKSYKDLEDMLKEGNYKLDDFWKLLKLFDNNPNTKTTTLDEVEKYKQTLEMSINTSLKEELMSLKEPNGDIKNSEYTEPDSSKINSAVERMKLSSKERFEELIESKVVLHFPQVSNLPDSIGEVLEEGDSSFQLKILRRFSQNLKAYSETLTGDVPKKEKQLFESLEKIFDGFDTIQDKMINHLSEEKLIFLSDGSVCTESGYDAAQTRLTGQSVDSESAVVKVMKKHKTLVLTKNFSQELKKELLSLIKAGVSKDMTVKGAANNYKKKIKSLPYWDHAEFDKLKLEFESELDLFCTGFLDEGVRASKLNAKLDIPMIDKEMAINLQHYLYGAIKYCKDYQSFYENLNFVATHGSAGFRFVFCSNRNTIGLVYPGDSVLKSETNRGYIIMSIVGESQRLFQLGQNFIKAKTTLGTDLYVTKGKSEKGKTLAPKCKMYERFISLFSTIYWLIKRNSTIDLSKDENIGPMVRLMGLCVCLAGNININNSSILDNVRYLINNVMANYSAAPLFIEEKLVVPCKNKFQLYLLHLTFEMLRSSHEDCKSIRLTHSMQDDEGNDIDDMTRVANAKIKSFLAPEYTYNNPDSLLQEVISLFFCTTKGLHDHLHNIKDVHKTPLSIQHEINLWKKENGKSIGAIAKFPNINRHQFDPEFVMYASLLAQEDSIKTSGQVRKEIIQRSQINEDPLYVSTMTSTRACLIESKKDEIDPKKLREVLAYSRDLINLSAEENSVLKSYLSKVTNLLKDKKKTIKEKKSLYLKDKRMFKNVTEGLRNAFDLISVDFQKGLIRFKEEPVIDYHDELFCKNDINKMVSSNVLTEVLRDNMDRIKNDKEKSIGELGTERLLAEKEIISAIRTKGQRTQKDREIYVNNLDAKYMLYPIEHTMKILSACNIGEKISIPGDKKIIDMQGQVEDILKWARTQQRVLDHQETNAPKAQKCSSGSPKRKTMIFNFNLDMTKWSPRDNILKYIFLIITLKCLKVEEKLYFIACMLRHYRKLLFLDHKVLLNAKRSGEELSDAGINAECIFKTMSNNFESAFCEVNENWFQGMFNYLSSYLHSGIMSIWTRFMTLIYGSENIKVQVNTHSDDNQTTLGIVSDLHERAIVQQAMCVLTLLCKSCTFEPSIKKNYISKTIKEFVSQINVGGEQKYLWVKPVMAMVSGIPYTTVKDDISSIHSKASEALSKGGPEELIMVLCTILAEHVKRTYGISNFNTKNKISESLGIREEWLPTALGNGNVTDPTTLALLGPDCMDKNIIHDIFHSQGFRCHKIRKDYMIHEHFSKEAKKALQLFNLLESISSDMVLEDESANYLQSFNPFKPVRYKLKLPHSRDPYSELTNDERLAIKRFSKEEYPWICIVKPRTPRLLYYFYNLMYLDSSFKASLAGQSPDSLFLHKIYNKNTQGNFTIRSGVGISTHKYSRIIDETSGKRILTTDELSDLLSKCLDLNVNDENILELWTHHIKNDKVFFDAMFNKESCNSSGIRLRRNFCPTAYQPSMKNIKFNNNLNLLLYYFIDSDSFRKEGRMLQNEAMAMLDLSTLFENHPDLVALIHYKAYNTDSGFRYDNYKRALLDLISKAGKHLILQTLFLNVLSSERTVSKLFLDQAAPELVDTIIGGINLTDPELIHQFRIKDRKLSDDAVEQIIMRLLDVENPESFADYIKKRSKLYSTRHERVYFIEKLRFKSVTNMYSSIRVIMSVRDNYVYNYTPADLFVDDDHPGAPVGKDIDPNIHNAIVKFSNLYTLLAMLKVDTPKLVDVMRQISFNNIYMEDIRKCFSRLSIRYKLYIICPLLVCSDSIHIFQLLSDYNIDFVDWERPQQYAGGDFRVRYTNLNYNLIIEGAKTISSIRLEYHKKLPPMRLVANSISNLINDLSFDKSKRVNRIKSLPQHVNFVDEGKVVDHRSLVYNEVLGSLRVLDSSRQPAQGDKIISNSFVNFRRDTSHKRDGILDINKSNRLSVVVKLLNGQEFTVNHRNTPKPDMTPDDIQPLLDFNVGELSIERLLRDQVGFKIISGKLNDITLSDLSSVCLNKLNLLRTMGDESQREIASWIVDGIDINAMAHKIKEAYKKTGTNPSRSLLTEKVSLDYRKMVNLHSGLASKHKDFDSLFTDFKSITRDIYRWISRCDSKLDFSLDLRELLIHSRVNITTASQAGGLSIIVAGMIYAIIKGKTTSIKNLFENLLIDVERFVLESIIARFSYTITLVLTRFIENNVSLSDVRAAISRATASIQGLDGVHRSLCDRFINLVDDTILRTSSMANLLDFTNIFDEESENLAGTLRSLAEIQLFAKRRQYETDRSTEMGLFEAGTPLIPEFYSSSSSSQVTSKSSSEQSTHDMKFVDVTEFDLIDTNLKLREVGVEETSELDDDNVAKSDDTDSESDIDMLTWDNPTNPQEIDDF